MSDPLLVEAVDDLKVVASADSRPALRIMDSASIARFVEGRHARWAYGVMSLRMIASDGISFAAALTLAHLVRFDGIPMTPGYRLALVMAPVLWVIVFGLFGLYASHRLSGAEEFSRVISASSMGIVLLMLATFWLNTEFSRVWIALTFVFALLLEFVTRRAWRWHASRLRAEGVLSFRTLIIGTDDEADRLASSLRAPASGFTVLGSIDAERPPISANGHTVAQRVELIRQTIRETKVDCLFVASRTIGETDMFAVAQAARREGVELRVYAHLSGVLSSRLKVQPVGSSGMALTLQPVKLTGTQRTVKRAFDLAGAMVLLTVAFPLMVLIALAIRLTSPGPLLFRQERVTEGGRKFRMHKFRTMAMDADKLLDESSIDLSAPFFKLKDDPRLTPIGKLLRRLSLDEIPQLIDVVKGDMSLVGPRPLPADQVAANLELLGPRHEVRAGVTGWWQINGRSNVDPEDALEMDLFYIENWSLVLDLYILARTAGALLHRNGAY